MTFAARTLGYLEDPTSRVKLTNNTAVNNSLSGIGGTATATYRLSSSGQASASNGASLVNITGEWMVTGPSSDFECQGTWGSGTGTTSGPTGWVALSSTRDYGLSATNNTAARNLTIEIRLASTTQLLATATISFEVDSAP